MLSFFIPVDHSQQQSPRTGYCSVTTRAVLDIEQDALQSCMAAIPAEFSKEIKCLSTFLPTLASQTSITLWPDVVGNHGHNQMLAPLRIVPLPLSLWKVISASFRTVL